MIEFSIFVDRKKNSERMIFRIVIDCRAVFEEVCLIHIILYFTEKEIGNVARNRILRSPRSLNNQGPKLKDLWQIQGKTLRCLEERSLYLSYLEMVPSFEINNLGSVFKQKFLVHNLTFQKIENVFHQPASIGKIVVSIIFVQLGDKDSGFCY